MIDVSIIWQKIKLIFSFLKFPEWIYKKIQFFYRLYKFKRLPTDKQKFLMKVYEEKITTSYEYFYKKNKALLKPMEIDGFIEIQFEYRRNVNEMGYYTETYYTYHITQDYLPIVTYIWRKNQEQYFQKTEIDYLDPDEIPF